MTKSIDNWRGVIEAALWCYYCPDQGGYRHDGDRDGRSVEDTFENLAAACEALGAKRDDHSAAWMSEEDAEAEIARVMASFAAAPHPPIAPEPEGWGVDMYGELVLIVSNAAKAQGIRGATVPVVRQDKAIAYAAAREAAERERCLNILRSVGPDNPLTVNDCIDLIIAGGSR